MKIDRINIEGKCDCGEDMELDEQPYQFVDSITELRFKCKTCDTRYFIHIQEVRT